MVSIRTRLYMVTMKMSADSVELQFRYSKTLVLVTLHVNY